MGTRRVELGPTGKTVAHNVARIRKTQGLTLRDVSERLAGTDRPLAHNTISEIERGARRADVDDLVALAVALNCSPLALLLPPTSVEHYVSITAGEMRPGWEVWDWGKGERPLLIGKMLDRVYSNLGKSDQILAAREQYRMNSDPQLQGVAGVPNVHPVTAPEGDGDEKEANRGDD
ncbi:helix-turn-helix domain-containing protein [Nocardia sp. NPDC049190]|uniref:helix-turn-helix domain-containing protein n=1 Tax=Nocardia sp. NPDC049190 TaxID=3155650 RepID=UPI0033FBB71C